jgi:putative addiction module component (TIGR02574 family)
MPAGELPKSLDTEVDTDAEAAWSAEIHRRVADFSEGRTQTVPWAEARRRIRLAAVGDGEALMHGEFDFTGLRLLSGGPASPGGAPGESPGQPKRSPG